VRNGKRLRNQPRGGARGFCGWSAAGSRSADRLRSTGSANSGTAATTTGALPVAGGGDTVPRHRMQCAESVPVRGDPGVAGSVGRAVSTRQMVANAVGSAACRATARAGAASAHNSTSKALPAMHRRWTNNPMERDVTCRRRARSNAIANAQPPTAHNAPDPRFAPDPSAAHRHTPRQWSRSPCGGRRRMKFLRAGAPSPYAAAARRYSRCVR